MTLSRRILRPRWSCKRMLRQSIAKLTQFLPRPGPSTTAKWKTQETVHHKKSLRLFNQSPQIDHRSTRLLFKPTTNDWENNHAACHGAGLV